jgi:hypothetical protein
LNPALAKLIAALPAVKTWIDQTLQAHANAAKPVANSGFIRLQRHYPAELLARARVVVVPRVPFPPLSQLGLPEFAAMETMQMGGVTYKDTFFVRSDQQTESLYFHELVHVVQWERLGVDNFLLAYAIGLLQFGYQQSPLEQMAYQLQAGLDSQQVRQDLVDFIREQTDVVWDRIKGAAGLF